MSIAWFFVSVFIAVVAAIVATELARVIGVVETGESSYSAVLNLVFVVVFVALLAVPIVFRKRFATSRQSTNP